MAVSFIACPIHRVKVAQQLYGGGLYATTRQLRREGSLYRGLPTVVLFEANGVYMMAYVQMKCVLGCREGELALWARVVADASANVLAWSSDDTSLSEHSSRFGDTVFRSVCPLRGAVVPCVSCNISCTS